MKEEINKYEEKLERLREASKSILIVLQKHEVTHRELNLLFEITRDNFEEKATIKKD